MALVRARARARRVRIGVADQVISNGALDLGTQAATLLLIKKYLAAAARQVPVGILPGFSCSVWPRLRESFGFGAFGTSDRDSVGAENHEGKHAKACGERTRTKLANAFGQLRRRICSAR